MSDNPTSTRQNRRLALQRFPIDGQALKDLVAAGMTWLQTNQQIVNALNVFPVPDGDTGTNMMLTMQSAFDEIENSPEKHAGKMMGKVAHGALMGARGNSGVILSQVWRGMANAMENEANLSGKVLAKAMASASDTAYKGVVKPVEGTILTVTKDIAKATQKAAQKSDDSISVLEAAVEEAGKSVERTPDLLPVLKEAGVVDSGGKGLFYLFEGMLRWINNEPLDTPLATVQALSDINFENAMAEAEEGQDYEVVVDFQPNGNLEIEKFYKGLEELGTSIQVGEGDGMYRMHIHVPLENRYKPIDYCMELGTITNVSMENLVAQMDSRESSAEEKFDLATVDPGDIAVVAVAPGKGIGKVFASLGVAAIVEGGQTMNPSTQYILSTFENLPTNKVIILPNNKNIIMAAEQAAELTVKEVSVVHSHTVPQGLAAMMRLAPQGDFQQVVEEMEESLEEVATGEITIATRGVEIDGVKVKEGAIIAMLNGKLVYSAQNLLEGCLGLLEKVDMDTYELITMFYGNNITLPEVEKIAAEIGKVYPNHEIEIQDGGQPHYQFIFSIE